MYGRLFENSLELIACLRAHLNSFVPTHVNCDAPPMSPLSHVNCDAHVNCELLLCRPYHMSTVMLLLCLPYHSARSCVCVCVRVYVFGEVACVGVCVCVCLCVCMCVCMMMTGWNDCMTRCNASMYPTQRLYDIHCMQCINAMHHCIRRNHSTQCIPPNHSVTP